MKHKRIRITYDFDVQYQDEVHFIVDIQWSIQNVQLVKNSTEVLDIEQFGEEKQDGHNDE